MHNVDWLLLLLYGGFALLGLTRAAVLLVVSRDRGAFRFRIIESLVLGVWALGGVHHVLERSGAIGFRLPGGSLSLLGAGAVLAVILGMRERYHARRDERLASDPGSEVFDL